VREKLTSGCDWSTLDRNLEQVDRHRHHEQIGENRKDPDRNEVSRSDVPPVCERIAIHVGIASVLNTLSMLSLVVVGLMGCCR
jgi:hypothetical protein